MTGEQADNVVGFVALIIIAVIIGHFIGSYHP